MTKSQPVATVLEGEWLTLAETVQTLNKSQSTIERLVASGALQSKLVRREGRKPERLYAAEGVKHLANGEGMNRTSRSVAVVKAPAETRLAIQPEAISALRDVVTEWRNRDHMIAITEKLWLSIDEAAELSGLSPNYIRDSVVAPNDYQEGQNLVGIRGGPRGAWRVQRASLEAFAG